MTNTGETERSSAGGIGRPAGRLPLLLALLVGTAVGGGAGAFVAGPLLAKRVVAEVGALADEAGNAAARPAGSEKEKGHGAGAAKGPVLAATIDNLVLNPAGSGGTRFLMLSLSLGVADEATAAELKAREIEVRDVVIGVLGRRSVAELASFEMRATLKQEVGSAVDGLLRRPAVKAVYFPQYVIQ